MSKNSIEQHHRKEATPASWKPGQSGNPKGRPRDALSTAIRELVDPRALISQAIRVIEDPKSRPADRLAAVQYLSDRGYTKPAEVHELSVGHAAPDPDEALYPLLSDDQLTELLALEDRRAAILATVRAPQGQSEPAPEPVQLPPGGPDPEL